MATPINVAINGFGRIGRSFFRIASEHPEVRIVGINDLGDLHNLAYLLEYDTAQGYESYDIEIRENMLVVDGNEVMFTQEREPDKLPWGDLNVDVVVESTGVFTDYSKAALHLDAGAKHVVISAPAKGEPREGISSGTALMGINEDVIKTCQVTSNASCTTNAGSPLIAILDEAFGIEKAVLNTVHGYTATQALVDSPDAKDFRRGRAAAMNIIPTTTGAAIATTKAYTSLDGLFDGIALRVPTIAGSIADITFVAKRDVTVEEVNQALADAASSSRWGNVFTVTDEPVVSSDIIGASYASIADLSFTKVVGGNLVKVLAWYDNEAGYTHSLVRHVLAAGEKFSS